MTRGAIQVPSTSERLPKHLFGLVFLGFGPVLGQPYVTHQVCRFRQADSDQSGAALGLVQSIHLTVISIALKIL